MAIKLKYYRIIGRDKDTTKTYYIAATGIESARQCFYTEAGDYISSIVRVTKENYAKNKS